MPEEVQAEYVGIDISAETLDVCLADSVEAVFANTEQGRRQLIARLRSLAHPRVVCEASGGYEKAVVAELLAARVEVCVVQPGRVRAFAYAEGLLTKTDRIDARLLRRFGQSMKLRLAVPVDPAAAALRELLEHRRNLTNQVTEVEGRQKLAGPRLAKLLQRQLTFLRKELVAVDKLIDEHIDDDPDLKRKSERLQQMKGVGRILAATLLAYVPELGSIESAQLAALIGVAPYAADSGKISRPRHIRAGRAQVRHVLYMASVSASRCNPILSAFYQRLTARGKPAKLGLVAVMRKMLCVLNRLIKEPDFVLAH